MSKKSGSSGGAKKEDDVDKNRRLIRRFIKSYEQLCDEASTSKDNQSGGTTAAVTYTPYAPLVQKLLKLSKSEDGPPLDMKTIPIVVNPPPALSQHDLALLLQALTTYPYYSDMSFLRANLADTGTITLSQFIKQNPVLTRLELIDNRIGSLGSKHLGKSIQTNGVLQVLNLNFNPLGDEGCSLLSLGLAWSTSLRTLSLQYCQIGAEGMMAFSEEVLIKNQSLTSIDLTGNPIGCEGITTIGKALPGANPQLKSLNLSATCPFRDCGDKGYQALCALCDGVEEQGMETVRDVLKLQEEEEQELLRIEQEKEERRQRGEYVPSASANEKKRVVKKKTADQLLGELYLTDLNLYLNSLDDRCAQRLLEMLQKRITITKLKIHEQVNGEMFKEIVKQMLSNREKGIKRARLLAKQKRKAGAKKKSKK